MSTEIGRPALPGGYVEDEETLDQAAVRELSEKTGIDGQQQALVMVVGRVACGIPGSG